MESAVFNPSSKQPQSNSNGLRNRTGLPQLAKRQLIDLDEVDQSQHKTKKMPFIGHSHGYPASRREFLLNDFYPEPQTPTNRPLPHHPIPQTGSLDSARATYHASESRPILAAISADADTCQIVLAIEDHKSHCKSILGNPNCAKHVISSKASLEEVRQRLLTVIGCRCSRCFRYSASKTPHIDPRVATSLPPISRRYATPEPSRSPPGAKLDEESTANTPKNRINNAQRNPRTPISPQPTNTESRTPKSNSRIWAKAAPIQWFEAQFENPKGPHYLSGHPQHPHVVKYKRLMHDAIMNQLVLDQLPSPKWKAQNSTAAILGEELDQMCGFPFDLFPVLGRRINVKSNTIWNLEDDQQIVWEIEKARLELMRRASDLQMRHSDLRLEMGTMTQHEWELARELHEHNEMWDLSTRIVVQSKLNGRLVESCIEEEIAEVWASSSDLDILSD